MKFFFVFCFFLFNCKSRDLFFSGVWPNQHLLQPMVLAHLGAVALLVAQLVPLQGLLRIDGSSQPASHFYTKSPPKVTLECKLLPPSDFTY